MEKLNILKLFLSLSQMIGSVILFIAGKSLAESLVELLDEVYGPGVGTIGVEPMVIILAIIFGIFFLIGLIFFLDTLKSTRTENFNFLKSKKFWIIMSIIIIIIVIFIFMGLFGRVY